MILAAGACSEARLPTGTEMPQCQGPVHHRCRGSVVAWPHSIRLTTFKGCPESSVSANKQDTGLLAAPALTKTDLLCSEHYSKKTVAQTTREFSPGFLRLSDHFSHCDPEPTVFPWPGRGTRRGTWLEGTAAKCKVRRTSHRTINFL